MFKETLKFNIKIYHLFLFLLFLSFSLFLFLSFSPPGGLKNFIRHLVGYHQTTLLIPMAKETLKFNIKMYHLFLFLLFLSFSFFLFLCFFLSLFLSYFLSLFLSFSLSFSLSLFLSFTTWWVKELYTPTGGLPPNITSYPHGQRHYKI